jgi:hypothetical protein
LNIKCRISNVKVKAVPFSTSTLSIEYLILDIGKREDIGVSEASVFTSSLGI